MIRNETAQVFSWLRRQPDPDRLRWVLHDGNKRRGAEGPAAECGGRHDNRVHESVRDPVRRLKRNVPLIRW
jgi:hypothetical protein